MAEVHRFVLLERGTEGLRIPRGIHDQLRAAARAELPGEAVGLIFGSVDSASRFAPLTNISDDPLAFRIDPDEFRAAVAEEPPIAFFHSHPTDIAAPSTLDIAGAAEWRNLLHLIFAFQPVESLTCWRIFDGQAMQERLEVI